MAELPAKSHDVGKAAGSGEGRLEYAVDDGSALHAVQRHKQSSWRWKRSKTWEWTVLQRSSGGRWAEEEVGQDSKRGDARDYAGQGML